MIKSVIFITNKDWNSTFQSVFSVDFPDVEFIFIDSKDQLKLISDETLNNSRLIAFFTDIIVPKSILEKVRFGSYNFHPSTPNRRGWAPLNYALLEGDDFCGVTLSHMTETIDTGPIIGVDRFEILPGDDFISANQKIFVSAFRLFRAYRKRLLFKSTPLLPMPIYWGSHFKTQLDLFNDTHFDSKKIDSHQLDRLVKAFGYATELCILRFKIDDVIYFFDHTKQSEWYKADFELFQFKFFRLSQYGIPNKLRSSPLFYNALIKTLA